jgi:prepilin-type N-terminal cleavage/methylation domain-containing protein
MSAKPTAPERISQRRGLPPPGRTAGPNPAARGLSRTRRAFTLIELLVVMGILGVLIALGASGIFSYLDAQKQTNTETTIRAIYQVLQQHWNYVVGEARKETPSAAVMTLANNDPRRAQVIWVKLRLMEAFPMSFLEISSSPLYTAGFIPASMQKNIGTYQKNLLQHLKGGAGPVARPSESIACLLMALKMKRGGVAPLNADSLGPSVSDTDGDGMPEIVDGWGTPLAFYRFPTGNTELNTVPSSYVPNPSVKFQDPLDSDGTLVSPQWYASVNKTAFEKVCHKINPVSGLAASPSEAYLVPVIASAGHDASFGYNPDMSVASPVPVNQVYVNDNICSHRLRLGARGD